MKDLLHYIVLSIVDKSKKVNIDEEIDNDTVRLTIHVDESEIGKIIGKEGKTIRAIREVVKILALKQKKYADIQIAEDN